MKKSETAGKRRNQVIRTRKGTELLKAKKPRFDEGRGGWVNPDRLPSEDLKRLARYLPADLQDEDKTNFLRQTSEAVDLWEMDKSENPLTSTDIANRIEKLEVAAKSLQRAIEGLQGDAYDAVHPHFDYLIWGSNPPIALPASMRQEKVKFGTLLEDTWETLGILRDTGEYARSHIKIDRTAKPTAQSARRLVFWVATKYRAQFGEYPPAHKTAWFPTFMSELGDVLQLEIKFGFSMISNVIENMRKTSP